MSLAKLPLRIATVLALRDRTWAGSAVFDSSIDPIEARVEDAGGILFLVVYTESSQSERTVGRDPTGFCPTVDLVIHAAVATKLTVTLGVVEVTLAATGAGLEAQLDLVEGQILSTLTRSTDGWSDLWRAFAVHHGEIRSRRGASSRKGLRFAARELVMPIETVPDPLGTGAEWPWSLAAERFAANDDTTDLAEMLTALMTEGADLPDWQKLYRTLGLDATTARAFAFTAADGEEVDWL